MAGRFALDIETVSPTLDHYETPPDFRDPAYFELLAVALGYESPGGDREMEMLFRRDDTPDDELDLVARTLDWLAERDGDEYITYGGETFDVPQLVGRARAAADSTREDLAERLRTRLEADLAHVDLRRPAWDAFGDYTRLETACREVGIRPEDTRWDTYDHGIDLDALRPEKFRASGRSSTRTYPYSGAVHRARGRRSDRDADVPVVARTARPLRPEDVVHLFDLADARPFNVADTASRT
ncbi:ribonuclease H-like domain-containing protein [Haladaptatus sp. W1]|uniref:ribonuclease H-like domain-containing protein n=1 Tax=Haladaptatus sp. W1 TaxID=1897478 RepID=UPI000A6AFD13|nr:ribonuclease H-like domain-containing protein [Haladaptatus sp. W1]